MRFSFPSPLGTITIRESKDGYPCLSLISATIRKGKKVLASLDGWRLDAAYSGRDWLWAADGQSCVGAQCISTFFYKGEEIIEPENDIVFFEDLKSSAPLAGIVLYASVLSYLRQNYYDFDPDVLVYHRLDSRKGIAYRNRLAKYYKALGFQNTKAAFQKLSIYTRGVAPAYEKWCD